METRFVVRSMEDANGYLGVWDREMREWSRWTDRHILPMRFKTKLAADNARRKLADGGTMGREPRGASLQTVRENTLHTMMTKLSHVYARGSAEYQELFPIAAALYWETVIRKTGKGGAIADWKGMPENIRASWLAKFRQELVRFGDALIAAEEDESTVDGE